MINFFLISWDETLVFIIFLIKLCYCLITTLYQLMKNQTIEMQDDFIMKVAFQHADMLIELIQNKFLEYLLMIINLGLLESLYMKVIIMIKFLISSSLCALLII